MSQIFNALKKVEGLRQNHQGQKAGSTIYLTDAPPDSFMTALMIFLAACAAVAIVMSITALMLAMKDPDPKQTKMLNLEKIINIQDRRINGLITLFNKTEINSEGQIRDLDFIDSCINNVLFMAK